MVLRKQVVVLLGTLMGAAGLLAFASGAWSQTSMTLDGDGTPYVAGELLVTLEPGRSTAQVARASELDARVEEEFPEIRARLFSFPDIKGEFSQQAREESLRRIKRTLAKNPAVAAVEYNYVYSAFSRPNDPLFGYQYGLKRPHFPRAWDFAEGEGATVAVLDTGIAAGHVDLEEKIAGQKDFINDDDVANDDNGHGTHVAGIAAASTNNDEGVAGACPDCDLLVGKVLNRNNNGPISDIVDGIIWSADQDADVINLSLGGTKSTKSLSNAVRYAAREDSVVVAAAGNSGTNERTYPAAYGSVIAVVATDASNERWSSSNYGNWVDVAAPGVGILSTTREGGYGSNLTGTSLASPHVAGLAGLLASQNRSRGETRNRIEDTARDLGPEGKDPRYGHGLIDAAPAVR